MTAFQEYLSRDMSEDDIDFCVKQAAELDAVSPWTDDTAPDPCWPVSCWLDVVMIETRRAIEYNHAQYCAQMD